MKIILTLFFLLFSSSVFADDISDFEIEGMSIGDSALDYFSEEEILNHKEDISYNNDKFYQVNFNNNTSFKVYDGIQIFLKTNDKNYIIYSIAGIISFESNINVCFKKKDEIVNEISQLLKETNKVDDGTFPHPWDATGKSKITSVYFEFDDSSNDGVDTIMIYCTDWSAQIEKEQNWADNLRVSIDSKEYDYWINNEAY